MILLEDNDLASDEKCIAEKQSFKLTLECLRQYFYLKQSKNCAVTMYRDETEYEQPKQFVPVDQIINQLFKKDAKELEQMYQSLETPFVQIINEPSLSVDDAKPHCSYKNQRKSSRKTQNDIAKRFLKHGSSFQFITDFFNRYNPAHCYAGCETISEAGGKQLPSFQRIKSGLPPIYCSSIHRARPTNLVNQEEKIVYINLLKCALLAVLPVLSEPISSPDPTQEERTQHSNSVSFALEKGMLITKIQRAFRFNSFLHDYLWVKLSRSFQTMDEAEMLSFDLHNQLNHLISKTTLFYNTKDPCFNAWREEQIQLVESSIYNWCCRNTTCNQANSYIDADYHKQFNIAAFKLAKLDIDEIKELKEKSRGILSTAMLKLLKEFALRYGIGEVYRRITVLSAIMSYLEFETWYIVDMERNVVQVLDFLRDNENRMFTKECVLIIELLDNLHLKLEYGFMKMFTLLESGNLKLLGIKTMILLCEHVIHAKVHYGTWSWEENLSVMEQITEYFKLAALKHYHSRQKYLETSVTTVDLCVLLKHVRKCFTAFEQIYFHVPQLEGSCNGLPKLIANTLYDALMNDIKAYCISCGKVTSGKVDQVIFHLVDRLCSLDEEWKGYITKSQQIWRGCVKILLSAVLLSLNNRLKHHMKTVISNDEFKILMLENTQSSASPPNLSISKRRLGHNCNSPFATIRNNIRRGSKVSLEEQININSKVKPPLKNLDSPLEESGSEKKSSDIEELDHVTIESDYDEVDGDLESHMNSVYTLSSTDVVSPEDIVHGCLEEMLDEVCGCIKEKPRRFSSSDVSQYLKSGPCPDKKHKMRQFYSTSTINTESPAKSDIVDGPYNVFNLKSPFQRINQNIFKYSKTKQSMETDSSGDKPTTNFEVPEDGVIPTSSSLSDLLTCFVKLFELFENICLMVYTDDDSDIDLCTRLEFLNQLYFSIGELLEVYSSNLLLLDACGVQTLSEQNQIKLDFELKPLLLLKDCYKIEGCRHCMNTTAHLNDEKESSYAPCFVLSEILKESDTGVENVTPQMCFRINNIQSLISILPLLQKKAANILCVPLKSLLKAIPMITKKSHVLNYCLTGPCDSPVCSPKLVEICEQLSPCEQHLNSVFQLQMTMMACRIAERLEALLEIDAVMVMDLSHCDHHQLPHRLYLTNQMKMLKDNLYGDCLRLIIIEIWERIIQKFHIMFDAIEYTREEFQREISNYLTMLKDIMKILAFDQDLYSHLCNQFKTINFRLKLLLKTPKDLLDVYRLLQQPTETLANILADRENFPLTFEEILVELRRTLPPTFAGELFKERLLLNPLWLNKLVESTKCKPFVEMGRKIVAIGNNFLMDGIIIKDYHGSIRMQPGVIASEKKRKVSNRNCMFLANQGMTITIGRKSSSSPSDELDWIDNDLIFNVKTFYKFKPNVVVGSQQDIYFYGTLFGILRDKRPWLDVFLDDILNLYKHLYIYQPDDFVKAFFVDFGLDTPSGARSYTKIPCLCGRR